MPEKPAVIAPGKVEIKPTSSQLSDDCGKPSISPTRLANKCSFEMLKNKLIAIHKEKMLRKDTIKADFAVFAFMKQHIKAIGAITHQGKISWVISVVIIIIKKRIIEVSYF